MKKKIIVCALVLCLVDHLYGALSNCSYIDDKKDAVQLSCGSSEDKNGTHSTGCFYDLFKSPSSSSNRAKVKMLRVYDNNCNRNNRIDIAKLFKDIEELEYSSNEIKYALEDMEFKPLEKLNMSHSDIYQIGFYIDSSRNLRELDVSYNRIYRIYNQSLEYNINLEIVNFSHNSLCEIREYAFSWHTKLTTLDLSFNKLKALYKTTFQNNKNLKVLRLQNNPLKSFDCDLLLPLSNLQLIDASFEHIEKLEINCENCSMHSQPDDPNVVRLQVNTNELRFPKTDLKTLRHFKLAAGCDIQNLNDIFLSLPPSTRSLDISLNNLGNLDTNAFGRFTELEDLKFDNAHLSGSRNHLTMEYFTSISDTLKKLRSLSISGNKLQDVSGLLKLLDPSRIEGLDLSENFVGPLDASTFQEFTNLKFLNLSGTNLSNFGFFHQNKLETLDISNNHLGKVDFTLFVRSLRNLRKFVLEGNDLTTIDTITDSTFPKLSVLGISKNRFPCDYLMKFLSNWNNLDFIRNPSANQTHIDGVDCRWICDCQI